MLMPVWHVRHIQQRHAGLFGVAVGFAGVTSGTSAHRICPNVPAAFGDWNYVIARQFPKAEAPSTISAHLPVTGKEQRVGQPWHMDARASHTAFDRDN